MSRFRRLQPCLAVGLSILIFLGPAPLQAFDTGHHSDLTRDALKTFGFNDSAVQVAQLENWLVDYYSNQPAAGLEPALKHLHFDSLAPSSRVKVYWDRFCINSRNAFRAAAIQGDSTKVVALLGMSLHAVQDFYTHSTWVEEHALPPAGFLTDTYHSNPAVASHPTLRTGLYPNHNPPQATDHGDGSPASPGVNHDSYARPRWAQAYVHAWCGSRQWIAVVKAWVEQVNPQVLTSAVNLSLSDGDAKDLARDLHAAFRISEWAPGGHWKGPGSQSLDELAAFMADWLRTPDSVFLKHFKVQKWHEALTADLGNATPVMDVPLLPAISHPYSAVMVRTWRVVELPVGFTEWKIDPGGDPDFFGQVTIQGATFVDAMQEDRPTVDPHWTTIAFVPDNAAMVPIEYRLFDEDGGARGEDDECDVNPTAGRQHLSMTLNLQTEQLSGDLQGIHNTEATAVTSRGARPDKDRADVKLSVQRVRLLP